MTPGSAGRWLPALCRAYQHTEERFDASGRKRIQGELLWLLPDPVRCPQATSLALPAAMSLSRLWQRQNKRDKARKLLAPIYRWFTEGFDTSAL